MLRIFTILLLFASLEAFSCIQKPIDAELGSILGKLGVKLAVTTNCGGQIRFVGIKGRVFLDQIRANGKLCVKYKSERKPGEIRPTVEPPCLADGKEISVPIIKDKNTMVKLKMVGGKLQISPQILAATPDGRQQKAPYFEVGVHNTNIDGKKVTRWSISSKNAQGVEDGVLAFNSSRRCPRSMNNTSYKAPIKISGQRLEYNRPKPICGATRPKADVEQAYAARNSGVNTVNEHIK